MDKYTEFKEDNGNKVKTNDNVGTIMKYISYWKWFIVSIILCFIIALVYLKFTLPEYEITTSILIKDDEKGGGASEMSAFKQMGLFTQKNNVDNELEVLRTLNLVEQVVRELGIYVNYTEIGSLPIIRNLAANLGSSDFGTYKENILYGSKCPVIVRLSDSTLDTLRSPIRFKILIQPSGVYEFTGTRNEKNYKVKASISDNKVTLPFGVVYLSRGQFRPANDMLVEVVIQNPVVKSEGLMGQLKMDLTSKTTSVVDITYKSSNVEQGRAFLNKMIEVYNRDDLNDQTTMANKTAQFIDDRLFTLSKELGNVESQVENYKQDQGLTDIKSESSLFIQQTGDFAQKRLEVETQLAIVSSIDDYMHKKENLYQLIPASSGIKSQGLSELINNYNRFIFQRNRLSRIASSSNQAMIDLTNQIESMYSTVQSSVRNEKENLQIAQRDLLSRNSENSARIRAIPRQEREFTEIKRQQGVKEALFLFLLQKKEEKYLKMSVVEPVAKIIDNVRSNGEPISPNGNMVIIFSFIIGLIIPIGGIKIRDLLRFQVSSKEELEELSIVPVLGEIQKTDYEGNVVIKENSTDTFTELVRLLRTNLLFVLDTTDKKVINIVSSVSGEGKTFVSINLAMSLALLDKKILIIGLDMRKPKLGSYLNLDDKNGMTLYLSGQIEKDQLIRPSGIHPNLSVILSGPIPPNPNELLAKTALDNLIKEYRKQFDFIFIDAAPILVVSDSFSLNRLADVNLYIVRADFTHKKNIEDATYLYNHNKLKEMYFVLNDVDYKKHIYRYGYDKKHGYGYGYEDEKEKKNLKAL